MTRLPGPTGTTRRARAPAGVPVNMSPRRRSSPHPDPCCSTSTNCLACRDPTNFESSETRRAYEDGPPLLVNLRTSSRGGVWQNIYAVRR